MRVLAVSFLVAACSAGTVSSPDAEADLTVVGTLSPQSINHGTITVASAELSYAFTGKAGDVVAPDVWPTGQSALSPTLILLGPKGKSGHRSLVATGEPRGSDDRHLAIDGFKLPQSGSYLVVIGRSDIHGGQFTLRFWTSASRTPRQEGSQVDLTLRLSPAAQAVVSDHTQRPRPWGDDEVDSIIAGIEQQPDPVVAFSDAQALLWSLAQAQGTAAQQQRAHDAAVALVGTPASFGALDPSVQAFALWWLDRLLFTSQQQAAPAAVAATVDELVASWPGATQDSGSPTVSARLLGDVVYGYQADWSATLADTDGAPAFVDYAREWFDPSGNWLGEQSDGASEPDDD